MRAEWRTPHDLCSFLELAPTQLQRAVMDNYARGVTDFSNDEETVRGLCVCLLWETLSNPGRTTIVTGIDQHRGWAMQFIHGIIHRNSELVEVTGLGKFDISFGTDPGWRIRVIHNNPGVLEGAPSGSTVVMLGAMDDWAIEFEPRARELEGKVIRTF